MTGLANPMPGHPIARFLVIGFFAALTVLGVYIVAVDVAFIMLGNKKE
jgi:hypothetical protein